MQVLIICDDYYHPGSVIREGLTTFIDPDITFDYIEDAREWSAERMAAYPVVLFAKSNDITAQQRGEPWVTEAVEQAFVDYVEKGGGLLAVHSGTASYKDMKKLRGLLGGIFDHHPHRCPVTVQPKAGHPLTVGSSTFTETDEHYFMEVDDPNVDVFVTTVSDNGSQPGAWTRAQGKGRVCVLTPGHVAEVWRHPSFQALLRNTLRWCASA